MADDKLKGRNHGGANPNNSTDDPRIIWEDGTWAIIEAGDHVDGIARTKTRDTWQDALKSGSYDPALTAKPGAQSIAQGKFVKVKLADLLAHPYVAPGQPAPTPPTLAPVGKIPSAKGFIPIKQTPVDAPVAPPSPTIAKPWKVIPEYPHVCLVCGGRYYRGLDKTIHQETEAKDGGKCPGAPAKAKKIVKV